MAEIFKRIMSLKTKAERMEELQRAKRPAILKLLEHAFNEHITWDLLEGTPPYKKNTKEMDLQHVLYQRIRMFEYFLKENYPNMKRHRREQIFINRLETVDPDDADLLVMVKDKKIRYHGRNMTKSFVWETFPKETYKWGPEKKKESA